MEGRNESQINGSVVVETPARFRSLYKAGPLVGSGDDDNNKNEELQLQQQQLQPEQQLTEAQLLEQLRIENAQLKRQVLLQSKRIDWIEERFDLMNWRVCSYDTWQLKGHHQLGVLCCRLNPTEGIVASGSNDKCILMWDLKTGQCTKRLRGHTGSVNSLYSEGNMLVSASSDKTICIWNFATGEFINKIEGHAGAIYKALIRDNKVFSASADRTIRIWDYSPSNSNDNQPVSTEEDGAKQIGLLEGHCGSVSSIHLHPVNQNLLISGSYDASVAVWDLEHGKMIKQYKGHESFVNAVTCSETLIASASNDCTLRIWDLRSNGVAHATLTKHTDFVKDVKVQGSLLVSAAKDGTVILWDYHYHDPIRVLKPHQAEINQLELLDNLLVTCSEDRTLRVHNFKKCVL